MKVDSVHPLATELVALARGALPPRRAEHVRTHCLLCDDCAAALEVVRCLRGSRGLEAGPNLPEVAALRASATVH